MTTDERKLFEDVRKALDHVSVDMAATRVRVEGLSAEFRAAKERTTDELKVLFTSKDRCDVRLAKIEQTYVRESELKEFLELYRQDTRRIENDLGNLQRSFQRYAGAVGVIVFVVQALVNWMIK